MNNMCIVIVGDGTLAKECVIMCNKNAILCKKLHEVFGQTDLVNHVIVYADEVPTIDGAKAAIYELSQDYSCPIINITCDVECYEFTTMMNSPKNIICDGHKSKILQKGKDYAKSLLIFCKKALEYSGKPGIVSAEQVLKCSWYYVKVSRYYATRLSFFISPCNCQYSLYTPST